VEFIQENVEFHGDSSVIPGYSTRNFWKVVSFEHMPPNNGFFSNLSIISIVPDWNFLMQRLQRNGVC